MCNSWKALTEEFAFQVKGFERKCQHVSFKMTYVYYLQICNLLGPLCNVLEMWWWKYCNKVIVIKHRGQWPCVRNVWLSDGCSRQQSAFSSTDDPTLSLITTKLFCYCLNLTTSQEANSKMYIKAIYCHFGRHWKTMMIFRLEDLQSYVLFWGNLSISGSC